MGTQPEKTTFEIFPGINIDPGKIADTLQGAALFLEPYLFQKPPSLKSHSTKTLR